VQEFTTQETTWPRSSKIQGFGEFCSVRSRLKRAGVFKTGAT